MHCTDLLARMNFMSAVNDLEVAGEAIQGGVIRSPFMYTLFAASDKEWGRHTVLCDTWPQSSIRKTVGQINK